MENQESRSNWDELAQQLGADVPAVDQPHPAAPEPAAEKQARRPPAKPLPPPPKRRPADWDGLMSQLGLATPEPAQPVSSEAPSSESPTEPVAANKPARRPAAAPASRAAADEGEASAGDGSADQAAERPVAQTPPAVAAKEAAPQGGGSVSLWHRIFGSPEEQAKKIADTSRGAEDAAVEAPPPDRADAEVAQRGMVADRFHEELETEEAGVGRGDIRGAPVGDATEDRKKRRPRRRRRGRGRKSDEQNERPAAAAAERPVHDQPLEDDQSQFEFEDDFEPDAASTDDEWSQQTTPAATSPGSKPKSPSHRSIPTWEETIGIMVDVNMQARSQRKQAARPSSRGNSSRGRSRGRRKKKS